MFDPDVSTFIEIDESKLKVKAKKTPGFYEFKYSYLHANAAATTIETFKITVESGPLAEELCKTWKW